MFQRPATWVVLVAVCVLSGIGAWLWFPQAFPVVTVDIRMDRQAALDAAGELAQRHGWGPEGYRQAASFGKEPMVQEFIELEGGGVERYRELLREGTFQPYRWEVRHFAEQERTETRVRFTPVGEPRGFHQILPEDEPGAALAGGAARDIAEAAAVQDWGVDLDAWRHVESSQEERPGGRVDHTFVYQRPGVELGEGRLRLRLVVGGDELTELTHYLEVPEAFQRRFEEMRSDNWLINAFAQVAVFLGLIGGAAVAVFLLYREGWLLWRPAVWWALLIATLQGLVVLNQLPLAWMNYDTALSATNFLLQQVGAALIVTIFMGLLLAVTFMAAESLTRRAFPQQVQLWRLWSPGVANTPAVAGRTVAGYLLLGAFFGYEVLVYLFGTNVLGWWTPSSELVHPDVLATYFPWLSAIAVSAQAGFWEECLFRAVPIAGAALLGERYGNRTAWIGGAVLAQALVFGAGHAAYPAQPAYVRVAELFPVAVGFGLIYIAFGLLPAVVLHYAYDVVWFAVPLFASSAEGVWWDRLIVVLLTLVPLGVVLGRRVQAGGWDEVGAADRNGAWRPEPEASEESPEMEAAAPRRTELGRHAWRAVLGAGLAAAVAWSLTTGFEAEAPPLDVGRAEAVAAADAELARRGIELAEPWQTLSRVHASRDVQHRFVWQEGGEAAYEDLLGSYLTPPHWDVRYARFTGDVAERAEEYQVQVEPDGAVSRFRHQLPEGRAGADLDEVAARRLAVAALRGEGLDPAQLSEISAVSHKRPERRDWTFTFEHPEAYPLESGQARVDVEVAGDSVVDLHRYVHVPEEWERADRDRQVIPGILGMLAAVVMGLSFVAGVVAAGVAWARGTFSLRAGLVVLGAMLVLSLLQLANGWPATMATFDTSQPLATQTAIMLLTASIGLVIAAAGIGVLLGWLQEVRSGDDQQLSTLGRAVAIGVAIGVVGAGLRSAARWLGPSLEPPWPSFEAADAWLPAAAAPVGALVSLLAATAFFLLVMTAVDIWSRQGSRRAQLAVAALLLLGLALAGPASSGLASWAVAGLAMGAVALLLYRFVLRHDLTVIPVAVATALALPHLVGIVQAAHPGAIVGHGLAILLLGTAALLWTRSLRSPRHPKTSR